jgi:hypothetical protein
MLIVVMRSRENRVSPGGGGDEIMGRDELRSKIGNIENYMDFYISKLATLFGHYPYAVHA